MDNRPTARIQEGGPVSEGTESIKVIALCGSWREKSITKMALSFVLKGASEYGVQTKLIRPQDYALVFCGQVEEADYPPDVLRLREEVKEANVIILGTPVYHGSMSGILKNTLDLMSTEEFQGKIVGLVGVAGGRTGAIDSLNTMRSIGRHLHCWVLPHEVSITDSQKTFNEGGVVTNPDIEERLLNLGRQAVKFASLQKRVRQSELMKFWEGLPTW